MLLFAIHSRDKPFETVTRTVTMSSIHNPLLPLRQNLSVPCRLLQRIYTGLTIPESDYKIHYAM